MPKVIIFEISDKIDEVLGADNSFKILDFDMLDRGICPNCNGDVTGEFDHCETCGVDWFNNTYEEIYEQIKG
jgi:hypothetical protein